MRAQLTMGYLNQFDLRKITRAVIKLFDDYNYKVFLAHQYETKNLTKKLENKEECFIKKKIDPILEASIKRENLLNYIDSFRAKMKCLKATFTDDERIVFRCSVEERKSDKEVCEELYKSYKTVYQIKKSCYVKIALQFGLIRPNDDILYRTTSL